MGIKRVLAATVLALFMGGVAFAQTSVLREADKRQRQEVLQRATENFVVVGPGVMRDKTTRLEWMRCSLGQDWNEKTKTCEGKVEAYTFENAQRLARRLNDVGGYNGKTDWRVPTKDELTTLIVCSHGFVTDFCAHGSLRPTIAQTAFPKTPPDWYWTSSLSMGDSGSAWVVIFSDGSVYYSSRDSYYHVRLVRASQ